LPNNGLIQTLYAQALLSRGDKASADLALPILRSARRTEPDLPMIFKLSAQAHAIKGDVPRAELATAEYAWAIGDKLLATEKAKRAQGHFKHGTPEWLRANDILTFAKNK
jgi:predicted Zn-dependent protease